MPCFKPLQAWRAPGRTKNGKARIVFQRSKGYRHAKVMLPCGQCIGCRLRRAREWAIRCVHESQLYEDNCFITLTYDPAHVPADGSVHVRDFQLFMKRLRKAYDGRSIRFFHCGEYGDMDARPHYHACLFNIEFQDKVLIKQDGNRKTYKSIELEKIWGKGLCTVAEVNFDTAAYVARYVMKKITGKDADQWYRGIKPEYVTMSRRPGIGREWYKKYKRDVYPSDIVVMDGVPLPPPRFYDSLLEVEDPDLLCTLKNKRTPKTEKKKLEAEQWRLDVKEEVKKSRLKMLSRNLEEV